MIVVYIFCRVYSIYSIDKTDVYYLFCYNYNFFFLLFCYFSFSDYFMEILSLILIFFYFCIYAVSTKISSFCEIILSSESSFIFKDSFKLNCFISLTHKFFSDFFLIWEVLFKFTFKVDSSCGATLLYFVDGRNNDVLGNFPNNMSFSFFNLAAKIHIVFQFILEIYKDFILT